MSAPGGRPEIGPEVKVRLPQHVLDYVEGDRGDTPRAEWLRELITEAITARRRPTVAELHRRADLVDAVAAGELESDRLHAELPWLDTIRRLGEEEYRLDVPANADAMALVLTEPSEATRRWHTAYEYAMRAVLGSRYWRAAATEREHFDAGGTQ